MFQVDANRWVFGKLGVFDLPKNIQRHSPTSSWRVYSTEGTFWEFSDLRYGNHWHSLIEATRLSITVASLPYVDACEYMGLIHKQRLTETGVTGIYYRRGLKESYKVIYNGSLVKIPYDNGKGFTKALRVLEELLDPTVERLFQGSTST